MALELPNLMHIRAFVRVADLGSVSRASDTLFRAQSVVTRAVGDLERRLGAVLFERRANGMLLTPAGHQVLPRAREALAELASTARENTEPLYLLNTRRLEVFVRLCAARHMHTVAADIGLTQPAISAALKVLENGVGQPLFERRARGLLPTRAAQDMLYPVRRALNALRHMDAELAVLQGHVQGLVTIGALPLGRTRILPHAINALLAEHPRVRIATLESPFEGLASELRAGDVDFILGALRPSDVAPDLHNEPLLSEEMVVLGQSGHPLLAQGISTHDLTQARWILPRAATPARQLLDGFFRERGLEPPVPVVETGDLALIRGLLLQSDMLAVVSAHQLEYEIANGTLQRLPVRLTHTDRAIGLIYRAGALHSPAALTLMEQVRKAV